MRWQQWVLVSLFSLNIIVRAAGNYASKTREDRGAQALAAAMDLGAIALVITI